MGNTMTQDERMAKVNQFIDEFAKDPDVIAIVKKIEGGIKTTQGNYGKYMQFLTQFASQSTTLYIMSKALIKAGADAGGVDAAVKILKG